MLIPYSWLGEFIKLKAPVEEAAERLSLASIGVEEIKEEGGEYVLDLEVTFNRGDLLSILGVARELAALYNLKLEGEEEVFKPQAALKSLTLQSTKELSPLYTLCLIEALSYQETPPQIRKRLELAGMRSVNLFADITNYVMLEYGQPLHAFDAEKVRERNKDLTIKVRNAKRGEKIKTLDGLTRNLESSDIVIADRKGPIAIAGIMGGEETEVDLNTKEILLEAAIFNPISIRRTARRLGLQSEASTRFEHYLSPENLLAALTKASKLYQLHGGGKVVGFGQEGKTRTKKEAVNLNKARLDALLGAKINFAKARKYLARLGFKVMSSDKGLVAWPPHFRGDITCEEDLIEEVARMEGYETLPATPPATGAIEIPQNNFEHLRQYLSELLVGLGFYEVRSYPFLNTEALTHRGTEKLRKIKNPISVETEYLKDSSLLNLLAIAQKNAPRYRKGKIFELEKIYPQSGEYFALTSLVWGVTNPYRNLKGVLEALLIKGNVNYQFEATKNELLHPTRAAKILVDKNEVGVIGEIHPHLIRGYNLKDVAFFEFNLEEVATLAKRWKLYTPISKYPEIYEDFSFFLSPQKKLGPLIKRIKSLDSMIQAVEMTDLFEKKEKRSITLRLTFQSDRKELSSQDIKPLREKVKRTIERSGGILRSGGFLRKRSGN